MSEELKPCPNPWCDKSNRQFLRDVTAHPVTIRTSGDVYAQGDVVGSTETGLLVIKGKDNTIRVGEHVVPTGGE